MSQIDKPGLLGKSFDIPKMLIWEAYQKVKANKGSAGVDEQSLTDFAQNEQRNLYKIWNRLSSGSYFPPPVKAVEIPKPGGRGVRVLGVPTVAEFIPASDPGTPSQTEITSPSVSINSTGNALPVPITITAGDTLVNNINNLEKYEGMRVHVDSLTVGAPTGGNVDEVNATSASFGDFYGVITGVTRPFREPGIELPYPTPTPFSGGAAPASAPTFDANPERLRINSLGLSGSVDLQVATGAVVTGITGPLDYGFRTYTIDTDPPAVTPTPIIAGGMSAVPVPTPNVRELTVASFNMQRFFDTTDDPLTSDVVLTSTAFNNRLNKASLAIRNIERSPDVIGIEEMENLTTLQAVASKVNSDSGGVVTYSAFLVEGNDVGGIDVAFLVKTQVNGQPRVTVNGATQYNKPGIHKVEITFNYEPSRRLRFYQFDPVHHDVAIFSIH